MAQILNFILRPKPPTQAEFEEICPDGGTIPDCEIHVEPDYWGAPPPTETYGDLEVVNCPMESLTAKCGSSVSVWMEPGCPPDTPDLVCDDVQNPADIAPDSSEAIYILDGYPPYEWEIVGGHGFSLEWESTGDVGGRPDERLNSWNTLYSSIDSCGTARIKITDNCLTEIICEIPSSVGSDLEYDWVNSGQTVTKGTSTTIYITGGAPPYTWAITGTGFSLHSTVTYSTENTVYASSGACGSGAVTVEDMCDVQIEGSVRCSDGGGWVQIEHSDNGDEACGPMFGAGRHYWYYGGPPTAPGWGDSWRGKYWAREHYGRTDLGWPFPGICDECVAGTTYGIGNVSCLLGRIPNCKEIWPWSDVGAGPCCWASHGFCHYITKKILYEWKCP